VGKVVKRDWEATYQTVLYALRSVPGSERRDFLMYRLGVSKKGLESIRLILRKKGYDVSAWVEAGLKDGQAKRQSRDWDETYKVVMHVLKNVPRGGVHKTLAELLGVSVNTVNTMRTKLERYGYDVSEWRVVMGTANDRAISEVELTQSGLTLDEPEPVVDTGEDDLSVLFDVPVEPKSEKLAMVQPVPAKAVLRPNRQIPWSFASLVELSGFKPTTVALACRIERVKRYRGHYTMLTEDEANRVLCRIGVNRV
jgi:hypothetical protein